MRVTSIFRYPIKGLSCDPLQEVRLLAGESLPDDRRFALARPDTAFDPERPQWLPKTKFVMLMRDQELARLHTRFDSATGELTIEHQGKAALRAAITTAEGRRTVETFMATFLDGKLGAPPRLVEAPGHTFSDAQRKPNSSTFKYVSLINLESVRALEDVVQVAVDPIRFRGNLYFDGFPAWAELGWVGRELNVGRARLKIVSPTTRCAATTVNPATAERDLNIPAILQRTFGHIHMGVYAEVVGPGVIGEGDRLRVTA